MPRLTDKLLPLLLALLLAVVPFTRTMADTPPVSGGDTDLAQPSLSHAHHMGEAAMKGKPCDSCTTMHDCDDGSCSCYQCGSCTATLLHQLLNIHFASLAARLPSTDTHRLSQHPFLLFRPPRA